MFKINIQPNVNDVWAEIFIQIHLVNRCVRD